MENEVIPAKVARALEDVHTAVVAQAESHANLLLSIVRLHQVCKAEQFTLSGQDVAARTGASKTYVSFAWRAAEHAAKRKGVNVLKQAEKLGYKAFTRAYLPAPKPREGKSPGKRAHSFAADLETIRGRITATLKTIPIDEKEAIRAELLDLLALIQGAVPAAVRPAHRPQRSLQ